MVSVTFPAVAKGDQTLSGFAYSAASVAFGATAPTLTAPTGARTALSYSSDAAAVCTVDASSGVLSIVGAGTCTVTATAASDGNWNQATATFDLTVTAAGALVLNVSAIAGDNTVNIAEKAAGFAISGDTGAEAGVGVSVAVGTATLTATSADDGGTATWSVSVPAASSYITGTSVDVTVSASKAGYTAPSDVERTLTVDLTAPTAPSYTAPTSLTVGAALTAISPSGGSGITSYGATDLPSGLGIAAATGVISGTPDAVSSSTATATVTVSDAAGNTATVDIAFPAVAKGDQSLSGFAYSASAVTFGAAAPTVTAPTGAQTSLGYSATPSSVCTVNASTGVLTLVGVGDCVVTATAASDATWNEARATFTVTVQAVGTLVLNVWARSPATTRSTSRRRRRGLRSAGDTGAEAGVSVSVSTVGTATQTLPPRRTSGVVRPNVVRERARGCVLHHGHER